MLREFTILCPQAPGTDDVLHPEKLFCFALTPSLAGEATDIRGVLGAPLFVYREPCLPLRRRG